MAEEYIKREAAIKVVQYAPPLKREIAEIPAADVVEVVRCRDCLHACIVREDFFCADGEKIKGDRE